MKPEQLVEELQATGTGRGKLQSLRDLLVRVGMSVVTSDELHRAMTDSGLFPTATIDKAVGLVKQLASQSEAATTETTAPAETPKKK